VLVLEVINELLQSRVVGKFESVPKRPLGLAVLVISDTLLPVFLRLTFCLAASMGSENPKKGRARLTNPFL
jgi:hypothetical protein